VIGVGAGVASDCPVDTWRGDVIGEAHHDDFLRTRVD